MNKDVQAMDQSTQGDKWAERYEKHITRQSEQIDALTKDVSALSADVRSLMRNQEALFNKTSRPFQWGAFVSALGLVAVGAGLLIAPIKDNQNRAEIFDRYVMTHLEKDAYDMGQQDADLEWLKKLEERQNDRLHSRYGME
jgi:hypothetical protein